MMRLILVVFSFLSFLLQGCFFGTFQTADSLSPGEVDGGWFINYPLYFDQTQRENAREIDSSAFQRPNIGGYFAYGASYFLDFGLRASLGEGIGPFAKISQEIGRRVKVRSAFILSLLYHPYAQGISARADFVLSKRLSFFSSLYGGWSIARMPDYTKIGIAGNHKPQEITDFTILNSLFFGVTLSRGIGGKRFIPSTLVMELNIPIHKRPPIIFGISLKF